MSKYDFKGKSTHDNSLVDLYLSEDDSLFYPSIPYTIYSKNAIKSVGRDLADDYITMTNPNRSAPITPLRTAWEIGDKWGMYVHDKSIFNTYGTPGICWVQNTRESEYNGRQLVIGFDGANYDGVCRTFERNFHNWMNVAGKNESGEFDVNYLPPSFISYRGWSGCTGWQNWRLSDGYGPELVNAGIEPSGAFTEYQNQPTCGGYPMHNGTLFWGISQVCDTGDIFAWSESGGETQNGCESTCTCKGSFMPNAGMCGSAVIFPNQYRDTGAVVWIAPSDLDTDTRYNNAIQDLIVESITDHGLREMGEIITKAKTGMYWAMGGALAECTSSPDCDTSVNAAYFYEAVYLVQGDPSLPIYTGKPKKTSTSFDNFPYTKTSTWQRWKQRPRHWFNDPQGLGHTNYGLCTLSPGTDSIDPPEGYTYGVPFLTTDRRCAAMTDDGLYNTNFQKNNYMSDEIPLSIYNDLNTSLSFDPKDEETGEPLIGANVTLVYEAQPENDSLKEHHFNGPEGLSPGGVAQGDPSGRKNYHPHLLRYAVVQEDGIATIEDWDNPETWIETPPEQPMNNRSGMCGLTWTAGWEGNVGEHVWTGYGYNNVYFGENFHSSYEYCFSHEPQLDDLGPWDPETQPIHIVSSTWHSTDRLTTHVAIGDYITAYINYETIRHGKPYEQKVIRFRIVE